MTSLAARLSQWTITSTAHPLKLAHLAGSVGSSSQARFPAILRGRMEERGFSVLPGAAATASAEIDLVRSPCGCSLPRWGKARCFIPFQALLVCFFIEGDSYAICKKVFTHIKWVVKNGSLFSRSFKYFKATEILVSIFSSSLGLPNVQELTW